MLSFGSNICSASDMLQKVKVEYLYHSLLNPKDNIASLVRQLRIIRSVDPREYTRLKKTLPYVVCAMFNPPYRRLENFAYAEYFILDLDHVGTIGGGIDGLKKKLAADSRVLLCFASPGQDGLKIMFRLSERCYDVGVYSLFYKSFARSFSAMYGLDECLDFRTCDATRACFVSVDRGAYFNPNASSVILRDFVDTDNVDDAFSLKKDLDSLKSIPSDTDQSAPVKNASDPDEAVMAQIKTVLSGRPVVPKAEVIVPEQLNQEIDGLRAFLSENGLEVIEVKNIQYAKNIKVVLGRRKAEINVYCGKRGFSVVICPRSGTDSALNELCADLIRSYLNCS